MSGGAGPFASPAWWFAGTHLAKVTKVKDPDGKGRVQVRIHAADPDGEALVWARVAVPFAGNNYGAFLLPSLDEEVVVVFPGADVRFAVVIGSLWTGAANLPEDLGGENVDRWTLTGRGGTRIAIVESALGQEMVEIETPGGASATLSDAAGGEIVLTVGTNTLTMDSSGVAIETKSEFSVQAATVVINSGSVSVTAGTSNFHGATTSKSHTTESLTSALYNSAPGNIW